MSTTASNRSPIRAAAGPGLAFHRILKSEFIKFRTLRSTFILLAAAAIQIMGIAALGAQSIGETFAARVASNPELTSRIAAQAGDIAIGVPTQGVGIVVLIVGPLGVLFMSSEFTTGMARSTFAAVPKRISLFLAKLVVVMVSAFALTAVASYIAGLVTISILDSYKIAVDLGSPQFIKRLLVSGVYVAAIAGFGMALGTILRSSAGGVVSLLGLVFVAPITVDLFDGSWFDTVGKYLPGNTLLIPLTSVNHVPDLLEAWQAALVLGAWVIVPAGAAVLLLKKRDV
ncbi:ABC transporter permease subunit [Arthrobacter sp. MA-N2]|uniref:ABC transporter permease subunit n=1 Tax=Arthrobacter sp. MA-N2 TaxID=1101188 RepID=UPI000489CC32|nr:ABC transporter permease subunit [Arthrobacter sp. MA-N2]